MAFPPRFLEDLRARVSITDVIGRRVRLTRKGRGEATGLCPFHNEKSPSFTVSEDKGFFHCFGCGAHGDVIGFVMRSEGLEFPQAVERLAGEAGMQVPRETPEEKERAERHQTLGGAVEFAAKHFEQQLRASAGRPGLEYFKRRGLTDDTIGRFRLGYSPDSRHGLKAALEKAGIPEAISIEAGLLIRPEDGGHPYDRFRGRVMFPILDRRGQAIAFGGRILDQGEPKYLNSPETPIFHKGRVLYGLSHAQKTARETNEIIVVEGYMDVIALAQAGISNAVAPLGTALTEEQIELLWRMAQEPTLCFDGDNAGRRAAARAADRAIPMLKPGLSLRFAWMPAGEDPDSLVRAKGPAGFREELDRNQPLVEVLWSQVVAGRALDTPERLAGLQKELTEVTGRIANKSVAEAYRQEFWRRFNESRPEAVKKAVRHGDAKGARGKPVAPEDRNKILSDGGAIQEVGRPREFDQRTVLLTLVNHPELVHRHLELLMTIEFSQGRLDSLRRAIIDLATQEPDLDDVGFRNHLNSIGFAETLDDVRLRVGFQQFTRSSASIVEAEEGLLHVLRIAVERSHLKPEFDATGQALAAAMSNPGDPVSEEKALRRFEDQRVVDLSRESRRRDLDR